MATEMEDLRILRVAEEVADRIWMDVSRWRGFARDVVGKQLARAADSVGANIAESYGRFHYGDKLQFLYYARGSLFEIKYWLNRASIRQLKAQENVLELSASLSALAHQINTFASQIKQQRSGKDSLSYHVRERQAEYLVVDDQPINEFWNRPLFTEEELSLISQPPNPDASNSPNLAVS